METVSEKCETDRAKGGRKGSPSPKSWLWFLNQLLTEDEVLSYALEKPQTVQPKSGREEGFFREQNINTTCRHTV